MIDIGGPAMLRAAAKNFAHVAPVAKPERYEEILVELRARGELSLETRRALAAETFALTAAYEAAIANWFTEPEGSRRRSSRRSGRSASSPTARTRTSGPPTTPSGAPGCTCSRWSSSGTGSELSFNNLNDLSAARGSWLATSSCRPA